MIAIMGVVGAGKSTIAKMLSERTGYPLLPEPVETNPYLKKFYEYPERYAFPMQIFMLNERFKQAIQHKDQRVIGDMCMYGNSIFAALQYEMEYMKDLEYDTYADMADTLHPLVQPPDLVVYLRCDPLEAIRRVVKRGRKEELHASTQYWFKLNHLYEQWYKNYDLGRKIMIDVSNIDVVNVEDDAEWIIDSILEALE